MMLMVLRLILLVMVCAYWMSKPPILHVKEGQLNQVEENWGWRCKTRIMENNAVPLNSMIETPSMEADVFVVSNKATLQKGVYAQIHDQIIYVKCEVRPMPSWLSSMSNGLFILDSLYFLSPDPDLFSYVAVILIAYRLFHATFVF